MNDPQAVEDFTVKLLVSWLITHKWRFTKKYSVGIESIKSVTQLLS